MAEATPESVVETNIPARLDALPWGRFQTLVVVALGVTWILDGLEVSMAGAVAATLKENSALGLSDAEIGSASSAYLAGAVVGGAVFWLADRSPRTQEAFLHHARALSRRHGRDGVFVGFLEFRDLSRAGGRGHWRRICGGQFDNSRTDPRSRARLDRPRDQRQLLDRRGVGGGGLARSSRSRPFQSSDRMASGVFYRRDDRPRDFRVAHLDSRKSALADYAWPSGRGRRHYALDRGPVRARRLRSCKRPVSEREIARSRSYAFHRIRPRDASHLSAPHGRRLEPHGLAGHAL